MKFDYKINYDISDIKLQLDFGDNGDIEGIAAQAPNGIKIETGSRSAHCDNYHIDIPNCSLGCHRYVNQSDAGKIYEALKWFKNRIKDIN